jgi:hypothetical protein
LIPSVISLLAGAVQSNQPLTPGLDRSLARSPGAGVSFRLFLGAVQRLRVSHPRLSPWSAMPEASSRANLIETAIRLD